MNLGWYLGYINATESRAHYHISCKDIYTNNLRLRGVFFIPSNNKLFNYKKRFDHAVRSRRVRHCRKTYKKLLAPCVRESPVEEDYEYMICRKMKAFH